MELTYRRAPDAVVQSRETRHRHNISHQRTAHSNTTSTANNRRAFITGQSLASRAHQQHKPTYHHRVYGSLQSEAFE